MIEEADDKKSLKKLESIGEYPGSKIVFDALSKINKEEASYYKVSVI